MKWYFIFFNLLFIFNIKNRKLYYQPISKRRLSEFKYNFEKKKLFFDQAFQDISDYLNNIEEKSSWIKEWVEKKTHYLSLILEKISIYKQFKKEKISRFKFSDLDIINKYKKI